VFQRLLALLGPKRIDDPVFGSLLFMKMSGGRPSYWEGKGVFPPLGAEIEYFVDAEESGPGEPQHRFWRELCDRYAPLAPVLEAQLAAAYSSWLRREPPPAIFRTFSLASVSIPASFSDAAEWDLSFDCRDDEEHLFTVPMKGWSPEGEVSVDG
jgi:hypothetical protein